MLMQVACFQSMQSRRFEARREMYWHKDKERLMETRNHFNYCWSPSKAYFFSSGTANQKSQQAWTWSSWCLCCLARILSCSKQASSLKGLKLQQTQKNTGWNNVGGLKASLDFARLWKLEQNTSGQLRGMLRGPQDHGNWSKTNVTKKG